MAVCPIRKSRSALVSIYSSRVMIGVLLAALAVSAQPLPLGFDTFDADVLDQRWQIDSAKGCRISLERDRGVLSLEGAEHFYNHLEATLPETVDRVQIDVCSVNDTSATWSPSLILYWDEDNYIRLMFSLHYSLRLEARANGALLGEVTNVPLEMGSWYRAAILLTDESIAFRFGPAGGELSPVGGVPRAEGWRTSPTLVVGKGHRKKGGQPDFDNNYRHGKATKRVEFDNLVVGDPAPFIKAMAKSALQRIADTEHDPASLQVAFWPNATNPTTTDTLWFAPGVYQRLCLIYNNADPLASARDFGLELRLCDGLSLSDVSFGNIPVVVEEISKGGSARYIIRPQAYAVPADFHGVGRKDQENPGWFKWPTSPRTPPLYVHCVAAADAEGGTVAARALAHSGAGPWREMTVAVTAPLSALLPTRERDLGLSLWQGLLVHGNPDSRERVTGRMMEVCKRLGVRRIHTNKHSQETVVAAAKASGIRPFLASWWHYSCQNTPDISPTPEEKATGSAAPGRNVCPVVIAEGTGVYGAFLETVTDRMRETGCEGFMLDYECRMPLCYCERCKNAFVTFTGAADVAWPDDVGKAGRYRGQWIGFRCHQGALYVKSIRDAARKAVPDCPMQAWLAGYDYKGTIARATIDVSKAAAFLTEPETPHYTLPADYSDMWTKDAGIGSIEAGIQTVEDTLPAVEKPIIFCSSIIYPLGNSTPWSDPQLLDVQIQTIIAAGARGVSFWGGHFSGGIDGRYMEKFVKWHNLLVAAGDLLWDGKRGDILAEIEGGDPALLRRFVWVHGDRCLVALTNLTQVDSVVTVGVKGYNPKARLLLNGVPVDLGQPLTVPALDGAFLVLSREGARQ